MTPNLAEAYWCELSMADRLSREGQLDEAFRHLERAHILGQSYAVAHTRVHVRMLLHGIRTCDWTEVLGQVIRIPAGFVGSLIGQVPIGNPGGANVPATKSFPVPQDLAEVLGVGET